MSKKSEIDQLRHDTQMFMWLLKEIRITYGLMLYDRKSPNFYDCVNEKLKGMREMFKLFAGEDTKNSAMDCYNKLLNKLQTFLGKKWKLIMTK